MYKPKTKEEYIALCRYYRGEERCPDADLNPFWNIEKLWVERHFSEEGLKLIRWAIKDYKSQGLEFFMADDGTPLALKAVLLAMYQGFTWGTPESFKSWYLYGYLQIRPQNCEK